MIDTQNRKLVAITPPGAIVDNASFTCSAVDCAGAGCVEINVLFGAMDIAMTALKVQESDDNGSADAYADVPGLVFGTSENTAGSTSSLPSATADNRFFTFFVDMRGRKRYLKLVATGGDGSAGTYMTAWAVLSRLAELPATATKRGASQELVV